MWEWKSDVGLKSAHSVLGVPEEHQRQANPTEPYLAAFDTNGGAPFEITYATRSFDVKV